MIFVENEKSPKQSTMELLWVEKLIGLYVNVEKKKS